MRRVVTRPDRTHDLPREQYVLDSAHHGLDRTTPAHRLVDVGSKPYRSTNGPVGNECWVSVSGDDEVVVSTGVAR